MGSTLCSDDTSKDKDVVVKSKLIIFRCLSIID